MKKNLIALAVAGVIAAPAVAMADATVYGKLHASYGSVTDDATDYDAIALRSHSSRLGVKGSEDLGGGLSANYQLEWEVDPFGDGNTNFGQLGAAGGDNLERRNQWIGLKGGFGEVRVGRHDTPLKMAQGKFDQFNDMDGDIGNAFAGEDRADNVVAYLNNFGPIGIAAAAIAGESGPDGNGGTGGDSFADAYSIAATYTAGPLFLSAGMTSYDDNDTGFAGTEDVTRLVATYNWNDMDFGALYSMTSDTDSNAETSGWGLSWGMGMGGGNKVKAQYLYNEYDAGGEITNMSLGFDHAFSKSTTVYAAYNATEEENAAGTTTGDFEFFGVGMILKF
jgi:predicted porin